ncbi:FAD-linked oxidase C-terminal domain-containing protein [Bradyrhizobium sp. HKCCYLS20291]|uniref:FAD-linked oxidase C-terminal domain-containing protein n=1 Tax=Bradyrhizobium sp. HKCCYLS20291 TaxID=3420766 RepID=UPI003EB911E0
MPVSCWRKCRLPRELELMRRLKQVIDPHGLMNPGKLLPVSARSPPPPTPPRLPTIAGAIAAWGRGAHRARGGDVALLLDLMRCCRWSASATDTGEAAFHTRFVDL